MVQATLPLLNFPNNSPKEARPKTNILATQVGYSKARSHLPLLALTDCELQLCNTGLPPDRPSHPVRLSCILLFIEAWAGHGSC